MWALPPRAFRLRSSPLAVYLMLLLSPHFYLLACCWVRSSRICYHGNGQFLHPRLPSRVPVGRDKWPSAEPLLRFAGVNAHPDLSSEESPGQALERDVARAIEGSDDGDGTTPTSAFPINRRSELHRLTSELGRLLVSKVPSEVADSESVVRSLKAVLNTQLKALEEGGGSGDSSDSSTKAHKRKLWDLLERLRRLLPAGCSVEGNPVDFPFRHWVPHSNPAVQTAEVKQFSWDSEQYSVSEAIQVSDGVPAEGAEAPLGEADFVQVRDHLLREIVSLPALLSSSEVEAAKRQLPIVSASEAKGPLFCSHHGAVYNSQKCARSQYALTDMLKDLRTTCISLYNVETHPKATGCTTLRSSREKTHKGNGASEVLQPEMPEPLSLFSLHPDLGDPAKSIGRLYCSRSDGIIDSASSDRRRGVVLLPGKLQARDARVRYLADRIAHCCRALVVVPELAPSKSASALTERHVAQNVEASLAVARLRPFGMHGLVARSLLWLHLHEEAEALALVGLADGGAEALTFASRATAASRGAVAVPSAAQQKVNCGVLPTCGKTPTPDLRGLPRIDAVVALYPTKFDVNSVAAALEAPTLSVFDEPTPAMVSSSHDAASDSASTESYSQASAFDTALRRTAHARDHWVQASPQASLPTAGRARELVSSGFQCSLTGKQAMLLCLKALEVM